MNDFKLLLRLFRYPLRYKKRLLMLLFISLFGVALEVAKPLPIKIIFDSVLANQPLPQFLTDFLITGAPLFSKNDLIIWSVVLAVFLALGSAVVTYFIANSTINIAQDLVYDFSLDVFAKLQRLSLSFYGKNQIGDLLQRINSDVFIVYFVVAQIALPALSALVSLSAMFYVMTLIDVSLALIALTVVPLLVAALAIFSKPMTETTVVQYDKQGQLAAFVQQSLTAIKAIQGFAREHYVQKKLEQRADNFARAYKTANKVAIGYNQLTALITSLAGAVLLGFGAYKGLTGGLSAGELIVFISYVSALYAPVNALCTAIGGSMMLGARGRRVFEILDSSDEVKQVAHPVVPEKVRGEVTFENVTFGYAAEREKSKAFLQDISFRVPAGKIIAVVGATGAGKTTLVSLLSRFYDPWSGRILIDGNDIKDLPLALLRENVSLVLQDAFLFPMSIAENIAFGRPGASKEEIIEVAEVAQAHDFITRLPEGYDTVISEGGTTLSGGEKQRIAIARALLKNAPILILDEPTSALDANTETKIFKALSKLMEGKTVFVISHRLSTIRRADQIITLKDGRIVERGTHDDLLSADKVYAELYKHQHIAVM